MKIEKILNFEDGNWVAYGNMIEGTDKRVPLTRGTGDCPFNVGDEYPSAPTDKEEGKTSGKKDERVRIASEIYLLELRFSYIEKELQFLRSWVVDAYLRLKKNSGD